MRGPWLNMALPLVVALVAPGCAWISAKDLESKLGEIDQDGDGAPFRGADDVQDCDDNDPDRSPGGPEIAYDGFDNNCDPSDDVLEYDVDGDGFPGISAADHQAILDEAAKDHEPMFDSVTPISAEAQVDCRDQPPEGQEQAYADIFPGAEDILYDGIDSNCDRSNDFDQDGDGFMPEEATLGTAQVDVREAFDAYVEEWDYLSELANWVPAGSGLSEPQLDVSAGIRDCADTDAAVFPGADGDVPYDGIDTNCDDVNDFDQDGDGYMPAGITPDGDPCLASDVDGVNCTETESGSYSAYVSRYYGTAAPPWTVPEEGAFLDCLDSDLGLTDAAGDPIDPALVYTGAPDAPYDGIDSDCNRDNDFDQDLDFFMPDTLPGVGSTQAAYDHYVTTWEFSTFEEQAWVQPGTVDAAPPLGDCDDTDPLSNPRGLEALSDGGADGDCDGKPDTSPWAFGIDQWVNPSPPKISRVGERYVILVTAEEAIYAQGGVANNNLALALVFPYDVASDAYHTENQIWKFANVGQPIDPVVDYVLSEDGDTIWCSTSYAAPSTFTQFLMIKPITFNPLTESFSQGIQSYAILSADVGMDSIDVVRDEFGEPAVVGCDIDSVLMVSGSAPPPTPAADLALPGEICFFQDAPESGQSTITACDSLGCEDIDVDTSGGSGPILTPTGLSDYSGIRSADHRDGINILLDDNPGVLLEIASGQPSQRFLTDYNIRAADAIRYNNEFYVIGLEAGSDSRIFFARGPMAASETITELPWEGIDGPMDPDLVLEGVSVHADDHRIAFAVSAIAETSLAQYPDKVGWMFLQP